MFKAEEGLDWCLQNTFIKTCIYLVKEIKGTRRK